MKSRNPFQIFLKQAFPTCCSPIRFFKKKTKAKIERSSAIVGSVNQSWPMWNKNKGIGSSNSTISIMNMIWDARKKSQAKKRLKPIGISWNPSPLCHRGKQCWGQWKRVSISTHKLSISSTTKCCKSRTWKHLNSWWLKLKWTMTLGIVLCL